MSERERATQLLNAVPDYKIEYAIMFLQGLLAGEDVPNETTVEAMRELENGGGESFDTLEELQGFKEFVSEL